MNLPPTSGTHAYTILMVDDTPANLGVVAEHLEEHNFRVVVAQDGEEALMRAQLILPDLILLDVMMPGIDGFETCRRLKACASTSAIPIIFMTALSDTHDKINGFNAGGVDYVTKPFQIEEVVARVNVHLALRMLQKQSNQQNLQLQQEIALRVHAETELQRSHQRLRQLSNHQEIFNENERKRIARDIHDDLGQALMALKIDVSLLQDQASGASLKFNGKVDSILAQIDAVIKCVRAIMNNLRPPMLDDLGLYAAIEWQTREFQQRNGIACKLTVDDNQDLDFILDEKCATALFRILQESLANIARHANASEVQVALQWNERNLTMRVADNGVGMQPGDKRKAHAFGLVGVKERMKSLGGKLHIESSPGKGTVISATVAVDKKR